MTYAALWTKSNFSFLEGASHPEELVEQTHAHGLAALALTDRDGIYGMVRAHHRARELGVHLIIGAQVTVEPEPLQKILLLVESRAGHANLCRLLTAGRLRSPKGECAVTWTEICDAAEGLLALAPPAPRQRLSRLRRAFGERLYALVSRHRLADEVEREARVREQARELDIRTVAAVEVLYHTRDRRPLQDVLTCIRAGVRLEQAGRRLRANAEHDLKPPEAMAALFHDDPDSLRATLEIAERCSFSLDELRYRYPSERLPTGLSSAEWLRQLTHEGARWRHGGRVPGDVAQQLERELELIEELDYPGYFLTMWEIVEFCRARGILCQGRGSAANSAVCYCLGITAVDPVQMGLLFERFISRERPDPPDIDLDIEHERREEVIQHVYDKYGRSHAAMAAVVVRYRGRSAIREVGKTLGLPETALDRLSKLSHRYDPDGSWRKMMEAAGLDPAAPVHRHLLALVEEIQDFPRHLSIHPGGFLLGHEPVHTIVPIENATMEARTVIQWDKDDLDTLGLFKVDLLGLGALSLLRRSFELLRRHRDVELTLAEIPQEDRAAYDMICAADTVGVFQIESRAQMAMLPRLRPRTFYDLVIEVSIVRPGPIAGDMVHPYLRRRHGKEEVTYPHPCLEPVLAKTLGVPLFQEQVMRLAVVAADYTPGEADQLRRDMAVWRRSGRLHRHRERLITRMVKKGIAPVFAERVFEQIQGFGEYGFPESHAASFALIAYATAWLRCHHLDVFTCALLNAQPLGFYTPATIVEDARRHGAKVRPVDVRFSDWDCTLEPIDGNASAQAVVASAGEGEGAAAREPRTAVRADANKNAVRMGLRYVARLGEADGQRVALQARLRPFADLDDFVRRTRLGEGQLTTLAEAGALSGLGLSRRAALWEVRRLLRARRDRLVLPSTEELPRFRPLDPLEVITWDYRASGHSPRGHPLLPLRPVLAAQELPDARAVNAMADASPVRYAGLVINRQQPGTARGVVFMTLEDETGFVNLVLWPDVFKKNAVLARTEAFLGVTGKLQKQDGVVHLVVEELWTPRLEREPAHAPSRDFH
jgi:error-prone DNA polymerase